MRTREVWQPAGWRTSSPVGSVRGAWARLLGTAAALVALAALLPGPGQVAGVLTGRRAATGATAADTAILLVAALAVWSLLAWILGIAAVAAVGRRRGPTGRRARRVLRHIAPVAVRNVLLTVAGAALLPGLTGCGISAPTAHPALLDGRITVVGSTVRLLANPAEQLEVDWAATVQPAAYHRDPPDQISVDWPAGGQFAPPGAPGAVKTAATAPISIDWPAGHSAKGRSGGAVAADGAVVVHRGDSLWSIAARHLPADPPAADIARSWHRWYAANATVIGHDPNLILPGQILLPPTQETGK